MLNLIYGDKARFEKDLIRAKKELPNEPCRGFWYPERNGGIVVATTPVLTLLSSK